MEPAPRATDGIGNPDWLRSAQAGAPWALESMYTAHSDAVYGLCYRLLCRHEDAEDAVQTTFIKAFRSIGRFRGECALKTWLHRIAVNQSIEILRKRKSSPLELIEDACGLDDSHHLAERLAVQEALRGVRRDHYVVLVLRFWQQLSYDEIADLLRVPLSTVKMRLKRAKDEFRSVYGESDERH
jgi:RNA polymerase sigma-70 factor (ECF subfamily)